MKPTTTPSITVEPNATMYKIRYKEGFYWADVCLDVKESSASFMANTDFGVYAHFWPSLGENPKEHLKSMRIDYVMGKLTNYNHLAFSAEKTIAVIEKYLKEEGKEDLLDAFKGEKGNWIEAFDYFGPNGYEIIRQKSDIFLSICGGDPIDWPIESELSPQCRDFYYYIWVPFMEHINNE